jgi:V/A-type H+-transporting ATPase subunit D
MSRLGGVAPTRLNLLRGRRRLERVIRGTALLRRKREALVREFFRHARPAAEARGAIEAAAALAAPALLEALAEQGRPALMALGWPAREVMVEVRPGQVWGLPVSDIVDRPPLRRTLAARGTAPGSAGPAAVAAAARFEALLDLLLDAAPRELRIRRLGEALGRTTRQVNVLERRATPALRDRIGAIRRTLDEREREERLRVRLLQRRLVAQRLLQDHVEGGEHARSAAA